MPLDSNIIKKWLDLLRLYSENLSKNSLFMASDANTDIIQLTKNNGMQFLLGFLRRIEYD